MFETPPSPCSEYARAKPQSSDALVFLFAVVKMANEDNGQSKNLRLEFSHLVLDITERLFSHDTARITSVHNQAG